MDTYILLKGYIMKRYAAKSTANSNIIKGYAANSTIIKGYAANSNIIKGCAANGCGRKNDGLWRISELWDVLIKRCRISLSY